MDLYIFIFQKLLQSTSLKNLAENPPCVDANGINSYMNNQAVRKALHIPTGLPEWAVCRSVEEEERVGDGREGL